MAGYWSGRQIAETFLTLVESDPQHIPSRVQAYLAQQADPRLTEIVTRLEAIYEGHPGAP